MSRKHFILFAEHVRKHVSSINDSTGVNTQNEREAMAEMIIACQDNSNFNKAKFLRACGLE